MKVAIMQPYFFPYIGYFQLMNAADVFVIYDQIEYTKKGWINRNRILVNGKDDYVSLPLKKDSDYLSIKDRFLTSTWEIEKKKMLNKIKESYRKAPYFEQTIALIEDCLDEKSANLFVFIANSLEKIKKHIAIDTKIIVSSSIDFDNNLKSVEKVLAICTSLHATQYINPIGGVDLYQKHTFEKDSIQLNFLKTRNITYKQYENEFIPFLSIIDVMMFNALDDIKKNLLYEFDLF